MCVSPQGRREYLQKLEENRRKEASQSPTTGEDKLFGDEGEANDNLFGTVPEKSANSSAYVGVCLCVVSGMYHSVCGSLTPGSFHWQAKICLFCGCLI